jgi:hypothetical protein
MTKTDIMYGQEVVITICKPSNRKYGLSLTKPRYQKRKGNPWHRFLSGNVYDKVQLYFEKE